MIVPAPNTNTAAGGVTETVAVGAASAPFTISMVSGKWYWLTANVAIWFAQGPSAPVAAKAASAANGSAFLNLGEKHLIDGACGAKLAVLQDSTGGFASLTLARIGR